MKRPTRIALLCLLLVTALAGARQATAADWRINLDPPGPREFVLDKAGILDPATKAQIQ